MRVSPFPFSVPFPVLLLSAAALQGSCAPEEAPATAASPSTQSPPAGEWWAYGRDAGGSRYSPLDGIRRENVDRLRVAWTHRTGEAGVATRGEPRFEATPLVVDGTLYLSTPLGRVVALDPVTGGERWTFEPDPPVDRSVGFGDFANRGVATWLDPEAPEGAPCRRRILAPVIDARVAAVDARTGAPCRDFGRDGAVDLRAGLRIPPFETSAYQLTSPPAVVGDVLVVGSAIADNTRIDVASGEVRAFDVRTGALRWSWDPIPQDPADPAFATWEEGSHAGTGGANAWSVLMADPGRDLVFVPTSSPAPDYYGGLRRGANRYASSLVALRASTGEVAWHFQTVHHDLWDYDNAAPPALVTVRRGGREIPAVAQATKTGMLYVLDRETGEPLFPVEERPVPPSDVPGEEAWPTQPFTTVTPPLSPHEVDLEAALAALGPDDRETCRAMTEGLRNEGIFTPPSLEGTLVIPSNIGGAHWGGVAWDPERSLVVVPVNRIAAMVQLIPSEELDRRAAQEESDRLGLGYQYTVMRGTPYTMRRRFLMTPARVPCTPPPYGTLVAVSLETGEKVWETPLGGSDGRGMPNLGGPLVTGGGLVFIAATLDPAIRAFDVGTGRELWKAELPAGARATPMTYAAGPDSAQYVVIAAGGGDAFGAGDHLVAFRLP